MATGTVMRRLSAIVAADVVGYAGLVRADEEGTLAALEAIREEIIKPKIAEYRGRIVKLMGDGVLAEFGSVTDSASYAVSVQKAVTKHQANVPENRRIAFRMGINLGDVIIDGDDIQGDGVNIASRLESVSSPGCVCVSDAVYEQVRNRLPLEFEDMGKQRFKSIDELVQVWQWSTGEASASRRRETDDSNRLPPDNRCLVDKNGEVGGSEVLSRPAVLFLPFEALGTSEEDRVLASGLCEDIRTTLACWRWFPVIGPEALRGQTGDVKSLAAHVGATYVMTGSVRRNGERARVTARLIDGLTGRELWSQAFDGALLDVFEFQEDVSRRIVSQIEPEISRAAALRIPVARPRRLSSWEILARAAEEERKGGDGYGTKEANEAQRQLVLAAIEQEPELSEAWARLARCHFREFLLGWASESGTALNASLEASARAVDVNPGDAFARAVRAQCMLFGTHDPIGALEHAQESVRLNPSNVMGHIMMGCVLGYCGEPDRAFDHYQTVFRLNPNHPNIGVILCDQMMCRALTGRMDEAIVLARKMIAAAPKYVRGLQRCAAVFAHAGELREARRCLQSAEELGGTFSESYVRDTYPFVKNEHLEFLIDGLHRAGWNG